MLPWRLHGPASSLRGRATGHNPFSNAATIRRHLALPSNRPQFLCEKLLGVDDEDPVSTPASSRP